MKYIMLTLLTLGMLIACGDEQKKAKSASMAEHKTMGMDDAADAPAESAEKLIYYTCPMESHKHIHSREAGSCTECGMALVEGVVTTEDKMDYYGCPMLIHSHVRHDEPGRCAECKMELKPMRLKENGSAG